MDASAPAEVASGPAGTRTGWRAQGARSLLLPFVQQPLHEGPQPERSHDEQPGEATPRPRPSPRVLLARSAQGKLPRARIRTDDPLARLASGGGQEARVWSTATTRALRREPKLSRGDAHPHGVNGTPVCRRRLVHNPTAARPRARRERAHRRGGGPRATAVPVATSITDAAPVRRGV
jgi:hypothetical protein